MKRTTKELMKILCGTNKTVLRIAERERWQRLRNADHGVHVYDVTDAQIERFINKEPVKSAEKLLIEQIDSTGFLLGLIDKRVCAVSFNASL
jgi:hypothetical protein